MKSDAIKSVTIKSLESFFNQFKSNTLIESENYKISFSEFQNLYQSLARKLYTYGIRPGDLIGIRNENTACYPILLFSIASLGAIPCLISTKLKNSQVKMLQNKTRLKQIVEQDTLKKDVSNLEPATGIQLETDPSNLKVVVFTSGSSSLPKAAVLTFESLIWNAIGSNENILFDPDDRWLLSLPFYHVGGLSIFFRAFVGGATVLIPDQLSESLKYISKVTHVSLVSTQLFRWLSGRTHANSLKAILLGGSAFSETLIKKCKEFELPIYKSYGLTEMGSQVCTTQSLKKKELKTSGKLLNYRKLKIINNEIYVKGKTRFEGFLENGKLIRPFDRDGWYATKDTGELTKDNLLQVTGRKDRLFVSGGENIQPEAIEQCLLQAPHILNARVVAVDNEEYGKRAFAYVQSERGFDENKLKSYLKDYLSGLQIPERIFDLKDLPESHKTTKDL